MDLALLLFSAVFHKPAVTQYFQEEIGDLLATVSPVCHFHSAFGEIYFDLITFLTFHIRFDQRQAYIYGITEKNASEGFSDHTAHTCMFKRQGSLFPGGATAKIVATDNDVTGDTLLEKSGSMPSMA